mgnify:CR=1 FL=1
MRSTSGRHHHEPLSTARAGSRWSATSITRRSVTAAGDRILDVISAAGGGGANIRGRTSRFCSAAAGCHRRLQFLLRHSTENIYVAPDDTISVGAVPYLALGAASVNNRFDFQDSNLTLGQARLPGRRSGRQASRSAEVVVYQQVGSSNILRHEYRHEKRFSGDLVPVIFRVSLRDPRISVRSSAVQDGDKDVLPISNSKSVELVKFLDILNSGDFDGLRRFRGIEGYPLIGPFVGVIKRPADARPGRGNI